MKSCKKIFPLLIMAVTVFLSTYPLRAGVTIGFEFSGQQEIVDKANLVSQKGSLFGFSFGTVGCRGDINVEMRLGYCRRKAEQIGYGLGNVSDYGIYIGGRYGPSSSPIFWIGKLGVQITFSALGGFNWLSGGEFSDLPQFSALLSGGLSICPANSSSRVLIEFVYRPVSMEMEMRDMWNTLVGTLLIKPSWCIRTSFIF
jgi:hypothetical protein